MLSSFCACHVSHPKAGDEAVGDDDDDDASNINKACFVCMKTGKEPTRLDVESGRDHRSWALKRFWGPFCAWCKKAYGVRYSYFSLAGWQAWMQEDESNLREARWYSLAYLSLREEKKVQITSEMLEGRTIVLKRAVAEASRFLDNGYTNWTLLTDLATTQPHVNPVAQCYPVEVMVVDDKQRLATRLPKPTPQGPPASENFAGLQGVVMHPKASSDDPRDLELLAEWCRRAPVAAALHAAAPEARVAASNADDESAAGSASGVATTPGGGGGDRGDAEDLSATASWAFELPRGRQGNAVLKAGNKIGGLLRNMCSSEWRTSLKDQMLRSLLRGCAGMEKELQKGEHTRLIDLNARQVKATMTLQEVSKCIASLQREFNINNLRMLAIPLAQVVEDLHTFVGESAALDDELLLLQANRCLSIGGACPPPPPPAYEQGINSSTNHSHPDTSPNLGFIMDPSFGLVSGFGQPANNLL